MNLNHLTVWKRLLLIIASGAIALVGLAAFAIVELQALQASVRKMADLTQAQRYSQRILVRAQDVRAQIALGLQHNPANGEIMRLHDHQLGRHVDALDKARGELDEGLALLRQLLGTGDADTAPLMTALDQGVARFRTEGVEPVRTRLVAEQFTEANILLLKQTNPSFDAMRQAAVALNDYVAKTAQQQVAATVEQSRRNIVLTLVVAALAIFATVALGLWVARGVTRQLGGEPDQCIERMERVAAGDLTARAADAPAGSLLRALDNLTLGLHGLMSQVRTEALEVDGHAKDIAVTAAQVAQSSEVEAEATATMAAALEQLTVSVNNLAGMAGETQSLAEQTHQLAVDGGGQVQLAATEMERIAEDVRQACAEVSSLDSSASQISNIANVIKEIAAQTNLLALNAAIEAARAGESGRGFAVVADEVRKLAERTTHATGDIGTMISNIQERTGAIARSMNDMLPQVETGTSSARQAAQSLMRINSAAEEILGSIRESRAATEEQHQAATSIAQKVEQIAQMVEETSSAMRHASENARETSQRAASLKQVVERFRL